MYLPAPQPFELDLRWLQAQAFRWCERDGWYYGFVSGHLIKVRNCRDGIEFRSNPSEDSLAADVRSYFRLDQDIAAVHDALREDRELRGLLGTYGGMRVLRQDPWECLVAYICSQRNGIKGIRRILDKLAGCYGEPLTLDAVDLYSFPSPQRLAAVGESKLKSLDLGLNRGSRIHEVAEHIREGILDLSALARWPHPQARGFLMSYEHIGPKIADCVCLFALGMDAAFPVDTNIGKGLERYGKKYTPGAENANLMHWVSEQFGANAGYAGQLLFLEQLEKSDNATPTRCP